MRYWKEPCSIVQRSTATLYSQQNYYKRLLTPHCQSVMHVPEHISVTGEPLIMSGFEKVVAERERMMEMMNVGSRSIFVWFESDKDSTFIILGRISSRLYRLEDEIERRRSREKVSLYYLCFHCFKGYQKIVKLGNVRVNINNTERLELVPARYLEAQKHHSQEILSHLKWLLQKDILKQDVFLLGVPGSMRSKLVLQYLVSNKVLNLLTFLRKFKIDIFLKELRNREYEYIAVTRDTTEADIKQRREIRGGTAFYTDLCAVRAALHGRVLVIDGVEKAERNVLPILNNLLENRSRFQCRNVKELEYETTLRNSQSIASSVVSNTVNNLISLIYAINSQNDMGFPRIPIDNIEQVMRIWDNCQSENMAMITGVRDVDNEERNIEISIDYGGEKLKINTSVEKCLIKDNKKFIRTQGQETLLTDLAIAHSQGDFALIGPKGSGKTIIIDELAKRLKFRTETMMLYQDMNSRELLQRRRMLENGDTVWEDSQLVAAAKRGSVCILDGAERVHWSALESLASLCHHRHLDLPGGGRLIGSEEFRNIMQKTGLDEEHLNSRFIFNL
uniref:VWFA domain-containing protein n=1 Tax=Heterorhabditis bacteriophora TaxID=37862 RepID=A0A1I7X5C3_HETBA